METITHAQVQEWVMRLPVTKLRLAYRFLLGLVDGEAETLSPQLSFLRLPLDERRRIMAEQARQMVAHYEQTAVERQDWQAGDFVDEY